MVVPCAWRLIKCHSVSYKNTNIFAVYKFTYVKLYACIFDLIRKREKLQEDQQQKISSKIIYCSITKIFT